MAHAEYSIHGVSSMDKPINEVTAGIITYGKRNLRFSFESVPAMTLSPGSSEFHPIAGEIVDLF